MLPALNNLLGNPPFFEYNKKDNEDSHLQRAHYPALKVANFTKEAVNFGRYCIVLGLDVKGGSNPDNRSQIKDATIEIGVQQLPLGEDSLVEASDHAREYIATVSLTQGPVLSALLTNAMYNRVFVLSAIRVDDVVTVVTLEHPEDNVFLITNRRKNHLMDIQSSRRRLLYSR